MITIRFNPNPETRFLVIAALETKRGDSTCQLDQKKKLFKVGKLAKNIINAKGEPLLP